MGICRKVTLIFGYFWLKALMYSVATPLTVGAKPHHVMLPEVADPLPPESEPPPPQAAVSARAPAATPTARPRRRRVPGPLFRIPIFVLHVWLALRMRGVIH